MTDKDSLPGMVRDHDRLLPLANIGNIMKRVIPKNGKISKEAKIAVQHCTSELISFVSSEAAEKCLLEKRKTITGDDLIEALETLGLDNYAYILKFIYKKYKHCMRR